MIQFNLLPDIKLEYVKTQRVKRLLTLVSVAVSVVALVILLLAYTAVNVVQKKSLRDLDKDTAKYSQQLKSVSGLDKILTVQNQLSTLTSLHDQKPVTSRLFTYISQVTPAQASLNNLALDFTAHTLSISGTAPSLDVVSTYTDTLKATMYTTSANSTKTHAFSSVVLSSFGRTDTGATFTITFTFDPVIFQSSTTTTLTVPPTAKADQSNVFQTGNQ